MISLDHPALANATGAGVSIAVIDSGVNPEHPHVGEIASGVALTPDGDVHDNWVDRLGHGTAVTAAIQEKAPDAEIHIIKVFDDALATSVPTLVEAIDWATERGIRLVNLSLGTPNAHRAEQLAPVIAHAVDRCTIVVSALQNEGTTWYPGALDGVVGVTLEVDCPRDSVAVRPDPRGGLAPAETVIVDESGGTARAERSVLVASGYPRPIPGVPVERNLNGISFASRLLDGNPSTRTWAYSERKGGQRWVRTRRHKLYSNGSLYDLEADPDEEQPVKQDLPVRQTLQAALDSLPKPR